MVSKDVRHYKHLVSEKIEAQAGFLVQRISERFPDSSLLQVAIEMHEVASQTRRRITFFSKPILWLRLLIGALILLILAVVIAVVLSFGAPDLVLDFETLVQLLESGVNDLVLSDSLSSF